MNTIAKSIKDRFVREFSTDPILVAAPGRINLIGGHTDYNMGFVLPAAINRYIFLAIQRSNRAVSTIISYDKGEKLECKMDSLSPLNHSGWENYILGVLAETQKRVGVLDNVNVIFGGNVPEGSGLSSSAAIENSLVFGLNELFNLKLDRLSMAKISQAAEHNFVGVQCGIMDQYVSMLGMENSFLFLDCRTEESEPIRIESPELEFLVINTNRKHSLAEDAYNERRAACERVAKKLNKNALRDLPLMELEQSKEPLSEEDYQKALFIVEENMRVKKAVQSIKKGRYKQLGKYLLQAHQGAKNLYQISCEELDHLVLFASRDSAVLGARMMGGGFGGCTVNLVHKDKSLGFQERIKVSYEARFQRPCTIYQIQISKGTHRLSI